jgi:hypothetical protein
MPSVRNTSRSPGWRSTELVPYAMSVNKPSGRFTGRLKGTERESRNGGT